MHPLNVRFENSELLAVPAVHFSHVFAAEVNRLCARPETCPEAIAVELGPQTAASVSARLGELCLGQQGPKPMPVMLGLTRPNSMIRASSRDKAMQLQQETGKDLSELPPKLLFDELGYAGAGLLCLCPTDSIIEAIRCALELNLPLHGVDLEEMADGRYSPVTVQDPLSANGDFAAYVCRNAAYAESQRDEEIDGRRELAMAARLKALLQRHRRVLFTCGMAHWSRIRTLLDDMSLRPALLPKRTQPADDQFSKVVVHPLLAVHHMDIFPALTVAYEKLRKPANGLNGESERIDLPDAAQLFSDTFRFVSRKYFHEGSTKQEEHARDLESLPGFRSYLENLAILHNRLVPDLLMLAAAARDTMSTGFVDALVNGFMDIPWATPKEHPDCSLLMPAPGHEGQPLAAVFANKENSESNQVFIRPVPSQGRSEFQTSQPLAWTDGGKKFWKYIKNSGKLYTWAPWDNIITGLSVRAIDKTTRRRPRKAVEVFAGNLLQGIAVKDTLRSFARGKEDILVRDTTRLKTASDPQDKGGFPVVFLLDPAAADTDWIVMFLDFEAMEPHIRNHRQFNHIRQTKGDNLVATIGFGRRHADGWFSARRSKVRSDKYHGIVLYQPLCWTNRQFARWVELSGYERNPICRDANLHPDFASDLSDLFSRQHGIKIGDAHWTTTLILMALPFTRGILPVVAPQGYRIEPAALEKARSLRVEIALVPMSFFTRAELKRLSICQMVPAFTTEPKCDYPPWVAKQTGEDPKDNLDLVPRSWLEFGM
jgi:hypothetical protein